MFFVSPLLSDDYRYSLHIKMYNCLFIATPDPLNLLVTTEIRLLETKK